MKLGQIVVYTDEALPYNPREDKPLVYPEYPAIIYRTYPEQAPSGLNTWYVGLYVFTDTGVKLVRKTYHNAEKDQPGTWRYS